MNKSNTIKELASAMAKAQAEMPIVQMNAVNPFLKNKFADLGAVISTMRPILAEHGLSYSQLPFSEEGKVGVTTIIMHTSGEWIESTVTLDLSEEKGKSAAQVAGSIITYLRRYSLAAGFGLYADEDSDGGKPETKQQVKPAKVTAPGLPKSEKPAIFSGLIDPQWMIDNQYSDSIPAAAKVINYLGIAGKSVEVGEPKLNVYRLWRNTGLEPKEAAEKTLAGEVPQE